MYVYDAAEAIIQALEKYDDSYTPLNIGTGKEITIKQLVEYIVDKSGYTGKVKWDTEKPDGQLKKLLDTTKMKEYVDINPISVEDGIEKTIQWYINHKERADAKK